jgi:hypothetical protein
MIRFPLVRHRPGKKFDTGFLETHFSFDTLFPDGLVFNGKRFDSGRHTAKENAEAGEKNDQQESKSKVHDKPR